MTNAELIKDARIIADSIHVHSSFQDWEAAEKDTLEKCADALEAADKRIAELMPKEGEWIDEQRGRWIYAKCNLCGKVQDVRSNYCPNCGARMDGETEHGNTDSLGKSEVPKGAMKKIIADGERKDGEHEDRIDRCGRP